MVLSVNSSSKAILGITTLAAFSLCTILFLRYRGNAIHQTTVPCLDQGRLSFLANLPLIGRIHSYFNPKTPLAILGDPSKRFPKFDELANVLAEMSNDRPINGTLVIYGDKLNITKDPGILALNLTKLILVDVKIVMSFDDDSLTQLMVKNGWQKNEFDELNITEVDSVENALKAALTVDPVTSKPIPTVYSVK